MSREDDEARESRLLMEQVRDMKSRAVENSVIWKACFAMWREAHIRKRFNRRLEDLQPHYLGHMGKVCIYCGILH
jgi:hypothetical protein